MQTNTDPTSQIRAWFIGRIEDDWFTEAPTLEVDRDEIVVIGPIAPPNGLDELDTDARLLAIQSRVEKFRESTRKARVAIARDTEKVFERKVSWAVTCEERRADFTNLAAPAMTRLRMAERRTLDTLVSSGVAKSRSDALAWCVRLVGRHEADWLNDLDAAMENVEAVRRQGPAA
ncbi:MAG: hypothetical protein OEW30_09760 [Acidimicrobiia bacterium]|nr:hypothetical protein [Acidimicrobiia bacterium]